MDCKGGIFRGTTSLAAYNMQPLNTVKYNGFFCNVKKTSLSTYISVFKRMLRGDGTKRLSAAFHRLTALCNQVAFCFVSPSWHVYYEE